MYSTHFFLLLLLLPSPPHSIFQPPSFPPSSPFHVHQSQCFGCCSAASEHCVTLLRAFALKAQTRRQLVARNVIQELVDFNLRNGGPQMQQKIRELLCIVTRDDETATAELNKYVFERVLHHVTSSHSTPTLVSISHTHAHTHTHTLTHTCTHTRIHTPIHAHTHAQKYIRTQTLIFIFVARGK